MLLGTRALAKSGRRDDESGNRCCYFVIAMSVGVKGKQMYQAMRI